MRSTAEKYSTTVPVFAANHSGLATSLHPPTSSVKVAPSDANCQPADPVAARMDVASVGGGARGRVATSSEPVPREPCAESLSMMKFGSPDWRGMHRPGTAVRASSDRAVGVVLDVPSTTPITSHPTCPSGPSSAAAGTRRAPHAVGAIPLQEALKLERRLDHRMRRPRSSQGVRRRSCRAPGDRHGRPVPQHDR